MPARAQLLRRQPRAVEVVLAELRRLDVLVDARGVVSRYHELAPGIEPYGRLRERRRRELPCLRTRRCVVEAERREHVPRGHRAGVVVAGHAIGARAVHAHRLARLTLRLPRLAEPVVVPGHPQVGLVAGRELRADVVRAEEAALVLHGRRGAEEVVEPLRGGVRAAKRLREAAHVLRGEPEVLVSRALLPPVLELGSPDAGDAERVWACPALVLVARTQEAVAGAPQVLPIPSARLEGRDLIRCVRAEC